MRLATYLVMLVIGGPAFAVCPDFGHPNLAAGPSIDLGRGIVAQSQKRSGQVTGREKLYAEGIYVLHDCDGGESLWLYTHREEPKGNVLYDREADVIGLLDLMADTPNAPSLGGVVSAAARQDIDIMEIGAVGIETCMCAEVYPGLKGGKVPYEDVK